MIGWAAELAEPLRLGIAGFVASQTVCAPSEAWDKQLALVERAAELGGPLKLEAVWFVAS